MKNFLKTFRVIIPAGEEASALAATGDNLAVYETNAPFIVRDDSGSLYEIDRACRVESLEKDGFGRLTLLRPPGVTGDIVIKLAVGSGVRLFDGRLQYTSNTLQAPTVNIGAVAPLPEPPTHGRFLPRYVAKCPLAGDPLYSANRSLGPQVTGGAVAGLNLLAPADSKVVRRILRLTSGAAVSVGISPDKLTVPGNSFDLTTANPELILPGGDSLFGRADADAALTLYEVMRTTAPEPAAASVAGSVAAPGVTIDVPRTLWASSSWNIEFGSVVIKNDFSNPVVADLGLKTSPAFGKVTSSLPGVSGVNSFAFAGVTSAEVPTIAPAYGESANKSYFYLYLRTESNQGTRYVTFDTGQRFEIPRNLSGSATNGTAFKGQTSGSWWWPGVFRAVIPWDGSPMYWEQNQWSGVNSWSRNP